MTTSLRDRFKKVRSHLRDGLVLLLIVVAFGIGYSLRSTPTLTPPPVEASSVQWYTCSMHPDVRMPKADDKCPICHMELIPVTSSTTDDNLGTRQIGLSPAAQALIDVETTPVERRYIRHTVNMVGQVDYDETRLAYITAYVNGRLDRLYVDYTGIAVNKGDHLAEIYSPELLVGRQELAEARRAMDRLDANAGEIVREGSQSLLDAARERLELLGLSDEQVKAAETGQFTGKHITLYAPSSGIVIAKDAKKGSYIKEGDRIYTIADLSQVWVILEAYESDLPWIRYGQKVRFKTQTFGDESFEGVIAFIDPILDRRKRTVRVRVNVDNTDGRLMPGMFIRAEVNAEIAAGGRVIAPDLVGKWICPMHPEVVRDQQGDCPVCEMHLVRSDELGYASASAVTSQPPLVVPASAVLRTGTRAVVYVKVDGEDQSIFEGREVELGPKGDGFFIVNAGLHEGDYVVTRGSFQVDSALQIQAKSSMMNPASPTTQPAEVIAKTKHLGQAAAAQLREVIDGYNTLAAALASDDEEKAKQAKIALLDVIEPTEWHSAAVAIKEAGNIEAIRKGFASLSHELIAVVRSVHADGIGPLYRAHCPMAFDFAGASWITATHDIANPYFGKRMLRCGTIEEALAQ